jgi:hypothetical protein
VWAVKVSSSCSISGTRRVTLDTNPVTSHEYSMHYRFWKSRIM